MQFVIEPADKVLGYVIEGTVIEKIGVVLDTDE